MVKTKNISSRIYMLVFYIRRMTILASCFFASSEYASLILAITCVLNHIYIIYIGSTKPLESRQLNNLEMFNELFVGLSAFCVMILSDWVLSQYKKNFLGYIFIIQILFYSGTNVILILIKTFNNIILITTKIYNLFNSYQNKKSKNSNLTNNSINTKINLNEIPNVN